VNQRDSNVMAFPRTRGFTNVSIRAPTVIADSEDSCERFPNLRAVFLSNYAAYV
jgi:hypothetical protein